MLAIYAQCFVKAEKIAEFQQIANELTISSRQDTGCISYHCGQVQGQENTFAFVELWQSQSALDAHLQTRHFQTALKAFDEILTAELDIQLVDLMENAE